MRRIEEGLYTHESLATDFVVEWLFE